MSERWTPFLRHSSPRFTEAQVREVIEHEGGHSDEASVRAEMAAMSRQRVYANNRYQVNVTVVPGPLPGWPSLVHLSIKRRDKALVGKERYRDFMRIKDELVGPEFEAVELYPARSREVDGANQYHLWCLADNKMRMPFGYEIPNVSDDSLLGCRQAPFRPIHQVRYPADHVGPAITDEPG